MVAFSLRASAQAARIDESHRVAMAGRLAGTGLFTEIIRSSNRGAFGVRVRNSF
jgi:hypothetical protein